MRSLLTAAAISLAFTLFLTPVFLRLFRRWGWGQVIRTPDDIRNPSHGEKRGTPTMGGTIFIAGTIIGYLVGGVAGNNPPTVSGLLVLWMMVGFGTVGFIDDFMKVRSQRSLGLSGWRKIVGQVIVVEYLSVLEQYRGQKLGPRFLASLIDSISGEGMASVVVLHAQPLQWESLTLVELRKAQRKVAKVYTGMGFTHHREGIYYLHTGDKDYEKAVR